CEPYTGREGVSCEGLTAHLERPWLSEVSVSAGVCPAVPNTVYLSLATTPMPTGGAPGVGRLQLLPGGEDEGSCEVNGRLYRDGEIFQPHCRIRCRCEDGGFTCVPLCSEDMLLITELVEDTEDPSFLVLSLPQPLPSPAQNGARPGAPAQPPVGWAWPSGCPTRIASAAWRPSAAYAYLGPVHPPGATAHGTVPFRARLRMETRCHPPAQQAIWVAGNSPAWLSRDGATISPLIIRLRQVLGWMGYFSGGMVKRGTDVLNLLLPFLEPCKNTPEYVPVCQACAV
ncbi:hypothetical protein E2I00_010919, partial [Balaenoptera physalus]